MNAAKAGFAVLSVIVCIGHNGYEGRNHAVG